MVLLETEDKVQFNFSTITSAGGGLTPVQHRGFTGIGAKVVQAAEEEEVEPQGLEIHRLLVPLKVKMVDLVVDLIRS